MNLTRISVIKKKGNTYAFYSFKFNDMVFFFSLHSLYVYMYMVSFSFTPDNNGNLIITIHH